MPILTYMSDLWGKDPHKSTKRVYNNFHKYVLGLPYNTVNTVALGELGRSSFASHTILKLISYWLQTLKHEENRYTKRSINEQALLAEAGCKSWGLDVKNVLFATGFGEAWINQGVGSDTDFLNQFKQRIIDIDIQDWQSNINSIDRLRTFKLIKTDYFVEAYTLYLNKFHLRKCIAKLRCGVLEIKVNEGRKEKVPYSQRLCTFCDKNVIDDEYHFMLICPFHDDLRKQFIPRFYYIYPNFQRFNFLLSTNSKHLCYSIAMFILQAMKERESCLF